MPNYELQIDMLPRPYINDAQSYTIQRALQSLGFEGIEKFTMGKSRTITLEARNIKEAREIAAGILKVPETGPSPTMETYTMSLRRIRASKQ